MIDKEALAASVAHKVTQAIRSATMDSARSQQSKQHLVGMSDMGGCREYLRLTVLETPFDPVEEEDDDLNLDSFIGTAFGDRLESILEGEYRTQVPITLTLPNGLVVAGTADIVGDDCVWDGKTTKHYANIRRHGPDFTHKAQLAGYLVGAVQEGIITGEEPYGALVYFDRLGKFKTPHVYVMTLEEAGEILAGTGAEGEGSIQERIEQVVYAVANNEMTTRDRPEEWCKVACPYYLTCRAGVTDVNEVIWDLELLQAVDDVLAARHIKKEAEALKAGAEARLFGINGSTRKHLVRWITVNGSETRAGYTRLDVREVPRPPSPKAKEKNG